MAKITVVEMRGFLERAEEAGRRVELEEDEKIDRGHLRSFTANGQACGLSAGVKFRAHPDTVAQIVDEAYDDSPKDGAAVDRGADWPPRGPEDPSPSESDGSPEDSPVSSSSDGSAASSEVTTDA